MTCRGGGYVRVRITKSKQVIKQFLQLLWLRWSCCGLSVSVILQSEVDANVILLSLWTRRNCKLLFTMRFVWLCSDKSQDSSKVGFETSIRGEHCSHVLLMKLFIPPRGGYFHSVWIALCCHPAAAENQARGLGQGEEEEEAPQGQQCPQVPPDWVRAVHERAPGAAASQEARGAFPWDHQDAGQRVEQAASRGETGTSALLLLAGCHCWGWERWLGRKVTEACGWNGVEEDISKWGAQVHMMNPGSATASPPGDLYPLGSV